MIAAAAKPRGRPRAFDLDAALAKLTDAFWDNGYAASSVDQLAAAAGLCRPSLYAAFGSKQAMYLAVLARVGDGIVAQVGGLLAAHDDVDAAVAALLRACVDVYLSGPNGPRGCLVVCTAATPSLNDPAVRAALADILARTDAVIASRFERASAERRLPPAIDPLRRARLVSAAMHSIAVRARSGTARADLLAIAEDAAAALSVG